MLRTSGVGSLLERGREVPLPCTTSAVSPLARFSLPPLSPATRSVVPPPPARPGGSTVPPLLDSSVFPVLRPSRVDLPRDPGVVELQARLGELKLSNKAIEDRETARIAATKAFLEDECRKGVRDAGYILRSQTPWFVMVPYKVLCWFLGELRASTRGWVDVAVDFLCWEAGGGGGGGAGGVFCGGEQVVVVVEKDARRRVLRYDCVWQRVNHVKPATAASAAIHACSARLLSLSWTLTLLNPTVPRCDAALNPCTL